MGRIAARLDTNLPDCALALAMLVLGQLDSWLGSTMYGPRWANACFMVLVALALVWRRTHPLRMTVVMLGSLLAQTFMFGAAEEPSGLIIIVIATYSAASYAERPWLPLLIVAVGLGIHDAMDPTITNLSDRSYDFAVCALAALFGFATKRRATRLVKTELELERERQRQAEVAEAATAEERARIARELHDIISHGLGIVVLQAGAAEQVLDRDPVRVRTALGVIRRTGLDAIDEMGRMLGLMRGEPEASRSPEPSLRDLPTLLDRARAGGLAVELETLGEPRSLPAPIELSAYRLIQEGLTNALKHASPKRAVLCVEYAEELLRVRLTNPAAERSGPGSGRGLPGMRERVSVFGGTFHAGPTRTGDWELAIDLPGARPVPAVVP
ncbi:MAG TPA: histidine kinase [Nocardioides sp.]|nr:histidine kinase [Nocardioides sp.]